MCKCTCMRTRLLQPIHIHPYIPYTFTHHIHIHIHEIQVSMAISFVESVFDRSSAREFCFISASPCLFPSRLPLCNSAHRLLSVEDLAGRTLPAGLDMFVVRLRQPAGSQVATEQNLATEPDGAKVATEQNLATEPEVTTEPCSAMRGVDAAVDVTRAFCGSRLSSKETTEVACSMPSKETTEVACFCGRPKWNLVCFGFYTKLWITPGGPPAIPPPAPPAAAGAEEPRLAPP